MLYLSSVTVIGCALCEGYRNVHGIRIDTVTAHPNGSFARDALAVSLVAMAKKAGVSLICYRCG